MSDLFVDNIKHQSSQGSGTITLGTSGEKITTASGAEFSAVTGHMYPMFSVCADSQQIISTATWTKITLWDTEIHNIGSQFSLSNDRFTPTVAGKYFFYCQIPYEGAITGYLSLSMNGETLSTDSPDTQMITIWQNTNMMSIQGIFDMNGSTDYMETRTYQGTGSNQNLNYGGNKGYTRWEGYRIGA